MIVLLQYAGLMVAMLVLIFVYVVIMARIDDWQHRRYMEGTRKAERMIAEWDAEYKAKNGRQEL